LQGVDACGSGTISAATDVVGSFEGADWDSQVVDRVKLGCHMAADY